MWCILHTHELQPHRVRHLLEQCDARFERKMAEVLTVYRDVTLYRAEPVHDARPRRIYSVSVDVADPGIGVQPLRCDESIWAIPCFRGSSIMKAYVEDGLGMAIVPKSAFSPLRDRRLRSKDVSHLFEPVTTSAFVLLDRALTPLVAGFPAAISPQLSPPTTKVAALADLYPDNLMRQASRLPEGRRSG